MQETINNYLAYCNGLLTSVALCLSQALPAAHELRGRGTTEDVKDKSYGIKDKG